jgi:predicted phosphodiesterase
MQSDYTPIIYSTPWDYDQISLYFLHDIHRGSAQHDHKKWNAVKKLILDDPRAYCVLIGDALENAVPNSKSDVFYQTEPPHEQKMWFRDQLVDLHDKTLAVLDGNHERNRSTKTCGMFPLYDACVMAGLEAFYRPHFALIDIGVGRHKDAGTKKQVRYFGYLVHRATQQVKFSSADQLEGIDFFAYGHDHNPADRPRGKLVYDSSNKKLRHKDVEVINCGSYTSYGGYAPDAGHRIPAQKLYKLELSGDRKSIRSIGFHV